MSFISITTVNMMQYQEDKFHPLNGDFSDDRYYVKTRAMKIGKKLRRVGT